jgi:hypothetical protein
MNALSGSKKFCGLPSSLAARSFSVLPLPFLHAHSSHGAAARRVPSSRALVALPNRPSMRIACSSSSPPSPPRRPSNSLWNTVRYLTFHALTACGQGLTPNPFFCAPAVHVWVAQGKVYLFSSCPLQCSHILGAAARVAKQWS